MMIFNIFLLLLIINYSSSEIHKCAQVPIIKDFDLKQYSGTWLIEIYLSLTFLDNFLFLYFNRYEIASIPFYPEKNLKCVEANYETLDSTTSSFTHSGIRVL